ncbi:MAG: T9SS type A sorting domain-containing protein [Gelidibacter sp.]
MKNYITLILIVFNLHTSKSQVTQIVNENIFPGALLVDGETLYFSSEENLHDSFVYKINPIESSSSFVQIVGPPWQGEPTDFLLNGNDLYIAEVFGNRISKIDITDSSPTPVAVASALGNVRSLALKNNDLYYSDTDNNNMIFKIDITQTSPTPIPILPANVIYDPRSIAIRNNELYFSSFPFYSSPNGKIYKIDISQPNQIPVEVLSGLLNPGTMRFKGDDLYFFNSGKISKIDVTDSSLTIVDVFNDISSLFLNMVIDGNDLYISEPNKIYKIDLLALSTNEFAHTNDIKLIPNPSSDVIQITGLKSQLGYKVYDIKGSAILENEIGLMGNINIKNLENGIYFIRFENGISKKFIKQ